MCLAKAALNCVTFTLLFPSVIQKTDSGGQAEYGVRSVEALLQIRCGLTQHYGSCINFDPPNDMLRNFNAKGSTEEVEEENMVSLDIE